MSDEMIVRYCSPTLANIKTANLFSCLYSSKQMVIHEIRSINQKLVPKGIRVLPVHMSKHRVLIYPFTDQEYRKIVSPMVMYAITERLSCHLEKERNHPLTTRRYYRQMEY